MQMCCREAPLYTRDLDEATSPRSLYKRLRVVHMTGFYAIRGQLELARHILQSSAALKRMIIDPKVRVPKAWPRECPYYADLGRSGAKFSLETGEFPSTVITIL
jgi:hypothetical protein